MPDFNNIAPVQLPNQASPNAASKIIDNAPKESFKEVENYKPREDYKPQEDRRAINARRNAKANEAREANKNSRAEESHRQTDVDKADEHKNKPAEASDDLKNFLGQILSQINQGDLSNLDVPEGFDLEDLKNKILQFLQGNNGMLAQNELEINGSNAEGQLEAILSQLVQIIPGASVSTKDSKVADVSNNSTLLTQIFAGQDISEESKENILSRLNELGLSDLEITDETKITLKEIVFPKLEEFSEDLSSLDARLIALARYINEHGTSPAEAAPIQNPLAPDTVSNLQASAASLTPGTQSGAKQNAVIPPQGLSGQENTNSLNSLDAELAIEEGLANKVDPRPAPKANPNAVNTAKASPNAGINIAGMQQVIQEKVQVAQNNPNSKSAAPAIPPGLTNALSNMGGNPSMMSGDGSSFSQNGGDSFLQELANPNSAHTRKSGELPTQNSFSNYMNGAKGTNNPTTKTLSIQIQRGVAAKLENITLQLDPVELGKIKVEMKISNEGVLKANLMVEKQETLSMLQRDSSVLEKALQDAGLDVDKDSLSFDLQQFDQDETQQANENNDGSSSDVAENEGDEDVIEAQMAVNDDGYITDTGVNVLI